MTTGQLSLFQPIDQPHISWNRWAVSLIAHVVFIAVVISIPVAVTRVIEPAPRFTETHLVAPVIPPQPVKVEAPKPVFERKPKPIEVKKFKAPPPPKVEPPKPIEAKIEPPKIIAPKPIEPPKVEMVRVPEPK